MQVGLWRIAAEDPGRTAIVDADGRTTSLGELAASSNRLVHGLRALGLRRGDVVATLLRNEPAMLELAMAALQGGLYLTPINHHLTASEVAYVLADSKARVLVASDSFADAAAQAADRADLPERARFTSGVIPGFRAYAELTDGQSAERPQDRSAGAPMHYTSGTTGRPKGVRRPLADVDPDLVAELYTGFLGMFGIAAHDGVHLTTSPLYHTAVLVFATTSIHDGHSVVLIDRWMPETTLERRDLVSVFSASPTTGPSRSS